MCKSQKYNVTPVVNAILVLADVETTLRMGLYGGKDKFNEVKQMFESSDLFAIPINAMDRVSKQSYAPLNCYMTSNCTSSAISLFARAS
jgi:hypothetical protein